MKIRKLILIVAVCMLSFTAALGFAGCGKLDLIDGTWLVCYDETEDELIGGEYIVVSGNTAAYSIKYIGRYDIEGDLNLNTDRSGQYALKDGKGTVLFEGDAKSYTRDFTYEHNGSTIKLKLLKVSGTQITLNWDREKLNGKWKVTGNNNEYECEINDSYIKYKSESKEGDLTMVWDKNNCASIQGYYSKYYIVNTDETYNKFIAVSFIYRTDAKSFSFWDSYTLEKIN